MFRPTSAVKAQTVLEYLHNAGVHLERVKPNSRARGPRHPATPEEITVSILAEIIQLNGDRVKPIAGPSAHPAERAGTRRSPSPHSQAGRHLRD
jgi:xanthine/CO dehydrogenase XdhC/CoxF family maturation factor